MWVITTRSIDSRSIRHQKLPADARANFIHAVQKLREVGVQTIGQDFFNAAELHLGAQLARAAIAL